MGMPMIIGAGIGALGSAAMGKSPFTGALLGGATGGLFGGAGGFGSGFGLGEGGLLSGMQGVSTTPVSMGTGGFVSGIGGQVIPNAITSVAPTVAETASTVPFGSTEFISPYTKEGIVNLGGETTSTMSPDYLSAGVNYGYNAPNFTPILGKSAYYTGGGAGGGGLFGSVKDMFSGLSTSDKLGLGMKGMNVVNQPSQPIQSSQGQIRQGNPNPSSPLFKVAPNITSSGLKDMMAHTPYTEEELMRLQQLAQYGYRG